MKDGVYIFKEKAKLPYGISFDEKQEIEIVYGLIYVGGYPLQQEMQKEIMNWLDINQNILIDATRNW